MDTQVAQISVEALAQQVEKLQRKFDNFKEDWDELKHWIREFKNSASSRRGLDGGKGDRGDVGPAGRDSLLIVKTDTATNTVHIFDEKGSEKATLISIPGRDGKDGISIPGRDGKDGRDGRTPTIQELQRLVAQAQLNAAQRHHEQVQ